MAVQRRALGRALGGAAGLLAGILVFSSVAPAQSVTDNQRTLIVSLPGPFSGCGFLDSGANATSNAINDLLLPSAFATNPNGNLIGVGGPIASAELVSLTPETVVYTIAPHQRWSNGEPFTGRDLAAWWRRARALASVLSDGYRAIRTLKVGDKGLSVTATFSRPYANWNHLFRDVEAPGTLAGCDISSLVTRPSLGPYRVRSATSSRIVLAMNSRWALDPGRYGRLVLVADANLPTTASTLFVGYSYSVTSGALQSLSTKPWMSSHLGNVSAIEEMTFAPKSATTRRILVREALSWFINRQSLINHLWGSVTFSPSIAASALYSQGQSDYPGSAGTGPSNQTPTTRVTTTLPLGRVGAADCASCAPGALTSAGFVKVQGRWQSATGAPLSITVATGPSDIDRKTTNLLAAAWRAAGVTVTVQTVGSDLSAAQSVAQSHVDVAVFSRPTSTSPFYTARSYTGPAFPDTYPSGLNLPFATTLYARAQANFNPAAAVATWHRLDEMLLSSYWVRPLFTPPSLVAWTSTVGGVNGALSVPGFTDEITGWNTIPATSGS
ncbi:MAG: ABC transporter substrate-binding protein [Acidimicrobiales bacterium]